MAERMDELSVVEELRLKTEELDMNYYLKTKWGGYTKQSVLDYLNLLRKQQQTTAETFYRNLQIAFNEKEELSKLNQDIQYQLNKIEAEYKNLCESMAVVQIEDSDVTIEDIIALKKINAAMEEEVRKTNFEKSSLENEVKHLNQGIKDLTDKLEQSQQEMDAAKEVIIAEKQEAKELREEIVKLTIVIEDKKEEIKYLKALQSEGQFAELTSHIEELSNQLSTQTEVMGSLNAEVSIKANEIKTLIGETELQNERINDLNKTVEELQKQNDKLLLTNAVFTKELEEKTSKTIGLIHEKSDVTVEKIAANRKLDEANSKIAMLELKLQQNNRAEEMKGCSS